MMIGINGYRSSPGMLFGCIDSLLILIGIFAGGYIRFWGENSFLFNMDLLILRVMFVVLVIQIALYYFDLYDLKIFRDSMKMGFLLLESVGVSAIFLAVIYYFIPALMIGRGIFAISLFLILLFTFLWRFVYTSMFKAFMVKEKILIVGTGALAKKIKNEILENGYDGFKIVGFIDESRDKIGNRV